MANNDIGENTIGENTKWYCHQCDAEVIPTLSEFKCSVCASGFIEQLEEQESSNEATNNDSTRNSSELSGRQRTRISDHVHQGDRMPSSDRPNRMFSMQRAFPFNPAMMMSQPTVQVDGFQGFVEQLMFGLMGGMTNPTAFNFQVGPRVLQNNVGDYIWSAEGLDNIVTMLMNQLEGTGPPPAAREQVEALQKVAITQEQVDDKLQCHICMENFQLEETVTELPCHHVYHGDCIVPWLELHGTCPVCRKRIDGNSTASNNSAFHSNNRS